MLFRDAVIETLEHPNMQWVNFQYGPLRIYPRGYSDPTGRGSVSLAVKGGHIQFVVSRTPHYNPVSNLWAVPDNVAHMDAQGRVQLTGVLDPDLRGTIVHEATHALQDYQRISMKHPISSREDRRRLAQQSEGAAYVAAWIARLKWGYPRLRPGAETTTSNAFARRLAERLIDRDIVYLVPSADASRLNSLVRLGSLHLYNFRGI